MEVWGIEVWGMEVWSMEVGMEEGTELPHRQGVPWSVPSPAQTQGHHVTGHVTPPPLPHSQSEEKENRQNSIAKGLKGLPLIVAF